MNTNKKRSENDQYNETSNHIQMKGYVYLIRNKDLYKIGITKNINKRMKALKPDEIIKVFNTRR